MESGVERAAALMRVARVAVVQLARYLCILVVSNVMAALRGVEVVNPNGKSFADLVQ